MSFRLVGEADDSQIFANSDRNLIVYPHQTHLILVEVLPNAGEVYDEDEYCVRFVLPLREIFGISTAVNYRGLRRAKMEETGPPSKRDIRVYEESS